MKQISIIAIVAADGAIGRNGDQPFHIRRDFKHFRQVTMGRPVVMGRRTFEALPGGALPGRRNIVVTRNPAFSAPDIEVAASLPDAVALAGDVDEVMVIGGGLIYAMAMPLATKLYVTRVEATVPDADTFFPEIDSNQWALSDESEPMTDEASGLEFRFLTYTRRDNFLKK